MYINILRLILKLFSVSYGLIYFFGRNSEMPNAKISQTSRMAILCLTDPHLKGLKSTEIRSYIIKN